MHSVSSQSISQEVITLGSALSAGAAKNRESWSPIFTFRLEYSEPFVTASPRLPYTGTLTYTRRAGVEQGSHTNNALRERLVTCV